MEKKLSKNMEIAMNSLPLEFTVWGSNVLSSNFPKGVTMKTINALRDRGLVKIVNDRKSGTFDRKVIKA